MDGLSPVTAEVPCGEEAHRITWRRGKLVLEDHDLLAERSLVALGSAPPLCLEILDAWRAIRGTEQLCDLLLRDEPLSPEDLTWRREGHELQLEYLRRPGVATPALKRHPQFQTALEAEERRAKEALDLEKRVWALTLLEALPAGLRQRLAFSVLIKFGRECQVEGFRHEQGNHVEAALMELALPLLESSAREWRRNLRTHCSVDIELWLRQPGEEAACTLWADSRGTHGALSLPLAWFTDVWARGLALVDGCFVLEVMPLGRRRDSLDVLALRWERRQRELSRAAPTRALAVRRGAGWRLAWEVADAGPTARA